MIVAPSVGEAAADLDAWPGVEAVSTNQPSRANEAMVRPRRGTVLAVDDRPWNLELLHTILANEGYEVITALSGPEALERLVLKVPDLILLDVMMPDMDGYEVCRRLKLDPQTASVAVIFLSAASSKESVIKGIEAGGVDYVTKPFTKAELIARVNTHVTLKHLLDHNHRLLRERHLLLAEEVEDIKRPLRAIAQGLGDLTLLLPERTEAVMRQIDELMMLTRDTLGLLNRDFEGAHRAPGLESNVEFPVGSDQLLDLIGRWYQSAHSRRIDFKICRPSQLVSIACHLAQLDYLVGLLMAAAVNACHDGDTIEVRLEQVSGVLEVFISYATKGELAHIPAAREQIQWLQPSMAEHSLTHEAERLGGLVRLGICGNGLRLLVLVLPLH